MATTADKVNLPKPILTLLVELIVLYVQIRDIEAEMASQF